MKKSVKFAALALAVLLIPSVAFAGSPWAGQGTYADQARGKLDFGLKNLLGGWSELLSKPIAAYKDKKNMGGALGQGLYNAVVFTVGGALHTVTFPITQIDIPLPDNGIQF